SAATAGEGRLQERLSSMKKAATNKNSVIRPGMVGVRLMIKEGRFSDDNITPKQGRLTIFRAYFFKPAFFITSQLKTLSLNGKIEY
ncbi:MAG: hypothetical protein KAX50_02695, partial [Saprospiraceae bacterium]|nr:hypothetical protein [Saprospiraceae bacterium]